MQGAVRAPLTLNADDAVVERNVGDDVDEDSGHGSLLKDKVMGQARQRPRTTENSGGWRRSAIALWLCGVLVRRHPGEQSVGA